MDAILMGVDREHLEAAVDDGLGAPGRQVSFGTEVWPDPLSFPTGVPGFFYEVRAEVNPVASFRATFVRYEADDRTAAFWERLEPTRPSSTKWRRDDPSLPDSERETPWGGYLFFSGLVPLTEPIPLSRFRIKGRPLEAKVIRRPLHVEWLG